jgi:phosphoribosylglycinamide formyltransferase-1
MALPSRLVVMISGNGSNLQAMLDACGRGELAVEIGGVISDMPDAYGLQRARQAGVPTTVVARKDYPDRERFDRQISQSIDTYGADVVALAGFMRILGTELVERFRGRMLNIHPSLLPRYRGLHTHRRALENRDTLHGASVHYVTSELDGGPVIVQAEVTVLPDDDEASLSARVQQREHIIYPRVIKWISEGRLAWSGTKPTFDGRALERPIIWNSRSGPESLP